MDVPIFHQTSESFEGYVPREVVHKTGQWHKGIQANIVVKSRDTFTMLFQRRSEVVDISKGRFDQSLATQMTKEDGLSEYQTLKRGLREELGITEFSYRKVPLRMKIMKTYESDGTLKNNELLSLYVVLIKNKSQVKITSGKVAGIFWLKWDESVRFVNENANEFTKTAQFYFSDRVVLSQMESTTHNLLRNKVGGKNRKKLLHINLSNQKPHTIYS